VTLGLHTTALRPEKCVLSIGTYGDGVVRNDHHCGFELVSDQNVAWLRERAYHSWQCDAEK